MEHYILVGPYIEFGEFHSVRARAGMKWSPALRGKRNVKKKMLKGSAYSAEKTTAELMAEEIVASYKAEVKASSERAISRTLREIPTQCSKQRDA